MEKQSETQTINRKVSDFRPLAELLLSWFNRHEAEWKANGVPEGKIIQLKKKITNDSVKGGEK